MEKNRALIEFFKSLRLAIKSASLYPKNHPSYENAIHELKAKTDEVLSIEGPVVMGFSNEAIFLDGTSLVKDKTFEDLAQSLHQRRIKSLELETGVRQEELSAFVRAVNMTPEDVFKQGGISVILARERVSSLVVKELDYLPLLEGEGEDIQDLWPFLLREAVATGDARKITEVADSFRAVISRLSPEKLERRSEWAENLKSFFDALKKKESGKYRLCASDLVKIFLRNKTIPPVDQIVVWKEVLKDVRDEDLAVALAEEIQGGGDIEAAGIAVVARLVEPDRYQKVISHLGQLFGSVPATAPVGMIRDRARDLITTAPQDSFSAQERWFLEMFVQTLSVEASRTIDRDLLFKNFFALLVNLLDKAESRKSASLILNVICGEMDKAVALDAWTFLKVLQKALVKRRDVLSGDPKYQEIEKAMGLSAERRILEGDKSGDLTAIAFRLQKSGLGVNVYLRKIFDENMLTPVILQLFYRFFLDDISYFDIRLDQKWGDELFLERLIDCLAEVDSPASVATLTTIFVKVQSPLKIRVLKTMQKISVFDETFLAAILKKGPSGQKKEALRILARDAGAKRRALEALFRVPSPFGLRNGRLRAHLRLVDEIGFKDAERYIRLLAASRSLWNYRLRSEAAKLLEKWHAG